MLRNAVSQLACRSGTARSMSPPDILVASVVFLGIVYLVGIQSPLGAQQAEWSVSADPIVTIGATEGPEDYLFQMISGALALPDGRFVVADEGYLNVRVFSEDGTYQQSFGGRGQGPGEFMDIRGLWLTPQSHIAVWDAENVRITVFDANGSLLYTSRVAGAGQSGGNLEVSFGAFSNGDVLLAELHFGSRDRGVVIPDRWVMGRFDLNGEFRSHLGHVRGMWRFNRNPIPFSPMPVVAIDSDSIFVADGYDAEIQVRDRSGAVVRTIQIPEAESVALSNARGRWESLEQGLGDLGRQLQLEHLTQQRVPRDDKVPAISNFLWDSEGLLWLKPYDSRLDALWLRDDVLRPGPGGEWWVLDREGNRLAHVDMPADVRPLEIHENYLVGVATDSVGVQRLVTYSLDRSN